MIRCWIAVGEGGSVHHIVKVEHASSRLVKRVRKPVQQGLFFVEARGEYADKLAGAFHQGKLAFSRLGRDGVVLERGCIRSEPAGLI